MYPIDIENLKIICPHCKINLISFIKINERATSGNCCSCYFTWSFINFKYPAIFIYKFPWKVYIEGNFYAVMKDDKIIKESSYDFGKSDLICNQYYFDKVYEFYILYSECEHLL